MESAGKQIILKATLILYSILIIFAYSCKGNNQSYSTAQKEDMEKMITVDTFGLDYIMGKFDPEKHVDFIEIPITYADRSGRYMRKDAMEAFIEMFDKAKEDGVDLKIISAVRNFDYQKGIWERKWTGKTLLSGKTNATTIKNEAKRALNILEYSSMPGTSRHHWGTDIDLNNLNNNWFDSGKGKDMYEWLTINASKYGFCQVYTKKGVNRPNGYNEEKWHWSYTPISSLLVEEAKNNLKNTFISGFMGANVAKEINVVDNYVLGIATKCF